MMKRLLTIGLVLFIWVSNAQNVTSHLATSQVITPSLFLAEFLEDENKTDFHIEFTPDSKTFFLTRRYGENK